MKKKTPVKQPETIDEWMKTPDVDVVLDAFAKFEGTLRGKDDEAKVWLTVNTNWSTPAMRALVREVRRLRREAA